ncbi:MAG: AAA family ATPase [Candidatus Peribacteria bacterium]|nr:AAA family ATPase [Candidatus Peribacteria bacterium]
MELAYLVADSLSLVSLRELWKRSDFSVLDKEMFHMLRGGSEKGKEKTASELVTAMSEKIQESTSTTELVKYDLLAPFFRKRLKKMRELFADPEVRKEFFKGFNDRKEHREVLATGKKDVEQVKQLDVELKNLTKQKHTLMLEKFFKGVKMSDIEKSTINEALIDIDDQLSNLESQKYSLLKNPNTAHRETATVWRLEELKKMKRRDGYVMTPSRQSIFNNAVEKFLEGNHILLKGDTGSGKTAIAVQIAKYIEELSAGKIKTMQIDGKKLESEAKDPEKLRKTEQMVFSGNPFTTQSDLIGKSKLKGDIEMEFQYSKLLTAFMEGRVLIFDELDSVPGDVLYRIKHLFEQRPMSLYAPQEDGGDRKTLLQTKIIATANIHSEHKYRDKEKIPVPIQDNLVGIEVPYMPKDEIYDFALVEMMTKDGFIKGVGERELTKEGIIDSLIECIDHIEQLFTGKTIGDLRI